MTKLTYRTHNDGLGDEVSYDSSIDFTDEPRIVREELRNETDLEHMLTKFGVIPQGKPVQWGEEIDWDLDLAKAHSVVAMAEDATLDIPEELKSKYANWYQFMSAVNSGAYERDLAMLADRRAREAEKQKQKQESTNTEQKP